MSVNVFTKKRLLRSLLWAICLGSLPVSSQAGLRECWEWVKENKVKTALYGTGIGATIGAGYYAWQKPDRVIAAAQTIQEKMTPFAHKAKNIFDDSLKYVSKIGKRLIPVTTAYATFANAAEMASFAGVSFSSGLPSAFRSDVHSGIVLGSAPQQVRTLIDAIAQNNPHVRLPKGILLYGPPGTGKTELIKAMFNRYNRNSMNIRYLDVASLCRYGRNISSQNIAATIDAMRHYGKMENFLNRILRRPNKKTIIFIDEFERVASARRFNGDADDQENSKIVSTLLEYVDGLKSDPDIIFIGATNSIESIDPAMLSRMRRIEMGLPTPETIKNAIRATHHGNSWFSDFYNRGGDNFHYNVWLPYITQASFAGWSYRDVKAFTDEVNNEFSQRSLNAGDEGIIFTEQEVNAIYQNIARNCFDPYTPSSSSS